MKWFLNRSAMLPLALLTGIFAVASTSALGATRQVPASATTSIRSSNLGTDQLQSPEFAQGALESDGAGSFNRARPGRKNGKLPKTSLDTPIVPTSALAGSNPELSLTFLGLNHRDQRLANGGNQFSVVALS